MLSVFSKNYMELKRGLTIRPSEMGVLNIIAQTPGPHTSVMLAELLGVSKPMITAHLTSLSEKGYITKEQSKDDQRVYYVLPTEKALALVESAKRDMDQQLSRLMEFILNGMYEVQIILISGILFKRQQNYLPKKAATIIAQSSYVSAKHQSSPRC